MLSQILSWSNLCDAWERVADNRGAPGVDRVSVGRFARHWQQNLQRLREQIHTGRYRPASLRRVAIPKPSGGQRLLQIPTVADRVAQRAVLNVLEPLWEQEFLLCSHGYRRGRGVRTALMDVLRLRTYGQDWVLDADIDDCFASLDHHLLQARLAEKIQDERLLRLIGRWLAQSRSGRHPDRGIALGMPLSPLLCNIYLHPFDRTLLRGRWALVRYADDFVICCHSQEHAQQAWDVAANVLGGLKLRLEPTKTRIVSFAQGFDYLGIHFERNRYSFLWQQKRFRIEGPVPGWLWGYIPEDYK